MHGQKQTLEIPWHETRILSGVFCGHMISRIYFGRPRISSPEVL